MRIYLILLVILFFGSCEKSILPSTDDKLIGKWTIQSATLYTNYRIYKAGRFVDSLVVEELPPNVNLNHFISYLKADHIEIGDVWQIYEKQVKINNDLYYYEYLYHTNFLQIYVSNVNRSFNVEKINKTSLNLLSPPQYSDNTITKYFRLKLTK